VKSLLDTELLFFWRFRSWKKIRWNRPLAVCVRVTPASLLTMRRSVVSTRRNPSTHLYGSADVLCPGPAPAVALAGAVLKAAAKYAELPEGVASQVTV
jgi:hypothetical protein